MARADPTTITTQPDYDSHMSSSMDEKDYEKGAVVAEVVPASDSPTAPARTVHRDLKSRHLQMIAMGGTLGTGLFLGSGATLHKGGPLGLWLGYSIMGTIVYSMMVALGEMTTRLPVSGAFTHFAAHYVDPAAGFAVGWNYWYAEAITLPTEIVAAALLIQYWPGADDINPAAWCTLVLFGICFWNFCGVRYYGEAEFWFSVAKITTMIGLMLLGLIITCGGAGAPAIGFRYWHNPGAFQHQNGIAGSLGEFLAFWTTFKTAAFSYLGSECVALTAAEAENPRRNIPKAIKRVFWRICIFYVVGTLLIGMLVSPNDPLLTSGVGGSASPWVIAIKNAGIKGLPSVVNAVILSSAFSAGNSDLYCGSRALYGMALEGRAPALFKKCTKNGLPIYCLILTASVGLLGFMVAGGKTTETAFNQLSGLKSIAGLFTWGTILVAYLRFYYAGRKQGLDRSTFAYRAPFQPYLSWYGLGMIAIIVVTNGYAVFLKDSWDTATFIIDYIPVAAYVCFYVGYKVWKRTRLVGLEEVDLVTGVAELAAVSDEADAREKARGPGPWYKRVWDAVM